MIKLIISSILLIATPTLATTYYVRPDGGNFALCNGQTDLPYSINAAPNCAWRHPFDALPPGTTAPPRISGGDTLIIKNGSYRMGYTTGVYDDSFTNEDNKRPCTQAAPYNCKSTPIPSGTIDNPTRILGEGWDSGCENPPELYGVERAQYVLDLTNSNYIEIQCLEITDHETCGYNYNGYLDGTDLSCKYIGSFPYGDWAVTGIHGEFSNEVLIKKVNIHGMGSTGIGATNISNWTVEDSNMNFNGYSGWGGGGDKTGAQSNSGFIHFTRSQLNNNGCIEDYLHDGIIIQKGCYDNYGDGIGTARTGGDWVFDQVQVMHNTSDGIDMLYHESNSGTIIIKNSHIEGNAGNQLKTRGDTLIENNIIIGNCNYFTGKSINGGNITECRGFGNPLSINVPYGSIASIINNSITRYPAGEAMIELGVQDPWALIGAAEDNDICSGNAEVNIVNNLMIGTPTDGKKTYAVYWNPDGPCAPKFAGRGSNNVFYNINPWPDQITTCNYYNNSTCDQDPQVTKFDPENGIWDLRIKTTAGPTEKKGLLVGTIVGGYPTPNYDIENIQRLDHADIGAYSLTLEEKMRLNSILNNSPTIIDMRQ